MKNELAYAIICIQVLRIANKNRTADRLCRIGIITVGDRKTDLARSSEPDLINCINVVLLARNRYFPSAACYFPPAALKRLKPLLFSG